MEGIKIVTEITECKAGGASFGATDYHGETKCSVVSHMSVT